MKRESEDTRLRRKKKEKERERERERKNGVFLFGRDPAKARKGGEERTGSGGREGEVGVDKRIG